MAQARRRGQTEAIVKQMSAKQSFAGEIPVKPGPMAASLPASGERDLRLDLFRGIALWLIFLDHIPQNVVNWFTIRNNGFSDATEIFIFISGYTAAFV